MEKTKKRRLQLLAASVFWLGVWQAAAMAIGQEVFLVSPVQALGMLIQLLPQAEFWQRVAFSAGRCPVPCWRWRRKNGSGWTPFSPR